jgi:hypothetical protein
LAGVPARSRVPAVAQQGCQLLLRSQTHPKGLQGSHGIGELVGGFPQDVGLPAALHHVPVRLAAAAATGDVSPTQPGPGNGLAKGLARGDAGGMLHDLGSLMHDDGA